MKTIEAAGVATECWRRGSGRPLLFLHTEDGVPTGDPAYFCLTLIDTLGPYVRRPR